MDNLENFNIIYWIIITESIVTIAMVNKKNKPQKKKAQAEASSDSSSVSSGFLATTKHKLVQQHNPEEGTSEGRKTAPPRGKPSPAKGKKRCRGR